MDFDGIKVEEAGITGYGSVGHFGTMQLPFICIFNKQYKIADENKLLPKGKVYRCLETPYFLDIV